MWRSKSVPFLVSQPRFEAIIRYLPETRDDIRLSGRAHHLIGKEAASLVREHQIVNVGVMQGTANDPDSEDKEATNFNLKYPPGY